jgi:hypothetical protein
LTSLISKRNLSAMKKSTPQASAERAKRAGTVKPRTLRLEPVYEVGLGMLKGVLHKPVNKMVNEAVAEYIRKRTSQVEAEMGSVLNQLKAYRRADPTFQQDKEAFILAEAEFGASDPMEGVVYKVSRRRSATTRKAAAPQEKKAGAALTMVREMLRS